MNPIKRICDHCGRDVPMLIQHKDFHGNSFTLSCIHCALKIGKLLNKLFALYGGIEGKCSCMGTPHIQSVQHLKEEIAKREQYVCGRN